jgi:SWI/SNF-related matrix-associated actin-dependent regulator of chromatin subfamily A-like protein 1
MTPDLIEKLAAWSEPKQVVTKHGDRILRTAPLTDELETFYQNNKLTLNQAGVVPSHYKGRKELCWWSELPTAVIAEKNERISASRATDAAIDIPCPAGLHFRGYQKAGVAFILDCFKKYGGALLADEPGVGKTIQACGLLNSEPKIHRVLIIVPKSILLNWFRELKRWMIRPLSIGIVESKSFPSTDIVIINYELVQKFENALSLYWDLIILDEAHRIRNPKTLAAKAIVGYRPTKQERSEGAEPKSGLPTRRKLALTGTPIENRPIELFTLLSWINPVQWKSRFDYARLYCGATKWNNWNPSGASNTSVLQESLRGTFMIRRRKTDPGILDELPPKQRMLIILPSDGLESLIRDERVLAERWAEKLAAIKAQSINPNDYERMARSLEAAESTNGKGVFKISHEIARAKVPLIAEHALEALEEGEKLVVFAEHLDVIAEYGKALEKFKPVRFTGQDSIVQRQRAVDAFQNDPNCRVFLGNSAAKEGITLTASSQVLFASLWWTPGTMRQMEDRLCRLGQRKSVLVKHFALQGSIDVNKLQALMEKEEIIEGALDRRGTDEKAPIVPRGTNHRPLAERIREQARTDADGRQMLLV